MSRRTDFCISVRGLLSECGNFRVEYYNVEFRTVQERTFEAWQNIIMCRDSLFSVGRNRRSLYFPEKGSTKIHTEEKQERIASAKIKRPSQ